MNFKKAFIKTGAVLLTAAMVLSGCSPAKSNQTLINIGDGKDKISLGYGNFVAKYYEAMYYIAYSSYFGGTAMWGQSGGEDGGTMEESVKNSVIDEIEESYLCKKHADEYDVSISDEEKEKIETAADKFMKNDDSALKAMGVKRDYVVDYLTYQTYHTRVKQAFEDALTVDISEDEHQQAKISYVKFSTAATQDATTGESTEMSDEDKAKMGIEATTLAEAGAENYESEAEALGQNVYSDTFDWRGDDFSSETLPEDVYKAAQKMSEGEISSPIEVKDEGYYVIRLDSEKDEDATNTVVTNLETEQKNQEFDEKIKTWKKDIGGMKLNEKLWEKVKFDDTFTATNLEGATTEPAKSTDSTTDETTESTDETLSTDGSGAAENTDAEGSGSAETTSGAE